MAPVFEHPDRKGIEKAYDEFSTDDAAKRTSKKVVENKSQSKSDAAKASDVEVETK